MSKEENAKIYKKWVSSCQIIIERYLFMMHLKVSVEEFFALFYWIIMQLYLDVVVVIAIFLKRIFSLYKQSNSLLAFTAIYAYYYVYLII